jgi:DNA (cytosine-5)-methyltransferase 1
MKHGSLFSGIGGFDLAAEWVGWENIFHCEWNEFGQRVLKYYWPNAISYHDITKTDFTIHRGRIDILTGGFPCQPYSAAGKRLGKEDDRHLWPQMLRAIREISPRWVVGENVFGLVNWSNGLVFHEVQADLETAGYEVFPYVLPACAVNAPHRRDRVWFVAYASGNGYQPGRSGENRSAKEKSIRIEEKRERLRCNCGRACQQGATTNPDGIRQPRKEYRQKSTGWTAKESNKWYATNPCNTRLQRGQFDATPHPQRQETRQQPSGPAPQFHQTTNWRNFPTQPPVCSRNDGLSPELDGITFPKYRNESIKAYGNAIVPQVAYQIFKAIQVFEF